MEEFRLHRGKESLCHMFYKQTKLNHFGRRVTTCQRDVYVQEMTDAAS